MSIESGNSEFKIVNPSKSTIVTSIYDSLHQESEKDSLWFRDNFLGKPHQNFLALDSPIGPISVSLIKSEGNYLAMVRTAQGNEKYTLDVTKVAVNWWRSLLGIGAAYNSILSALHYTIPIDSLSLVKNPDLPLDLLKLEERQIVNSYKFGILYLSNGQSTEHQSLSNTHDLASEAYLKFLTLMGEEITLSQWTGYRAGLDTSGNDLTGTKSIFTKWQGYDIMFHVATLLPLKNDDPQRVERKKHIGNDICCIIFQDSDEPFQMSTILSRQNHIIIVVKPENDGYRISVSTKTGVQDFKPGVPENSFIKHDFVSRDYLMHLLISGERASYRSQSFAPKLERARSILISEIAAKHNAIEHDASLSRLDADLGNNTILDENVYAPIYQYALKGDDDKWHLSLSNLAKFRKFRQQESKKKHPSTYSFGVKGSIAASFEAAILFLYFRDQTNEARMEWIDIFFKEERLPFDLGWNVSPIKKFEVLATASKILLLSSM